MEEKIKQLIDRYIEFLKRNPGNEDEVYKWEAIVHFHKHWNPDAKHFWEMFKEAFKKQVNLIYPIAFNFYRALAKYDEEKLKHLILSLYDENVDLETRFYRHKELSDQYMDEINKQTGKNNKHFQDDRSIAFLLSFYRPDKYYLYKSTIHRQLCNYLGIKKVSGFYKQYRHYAGIGDEFLPYIRENQTLQTLAKNFIPEDFHFDSSHLLFQDMVYQMLMPEDKKLSDFHKQLLKIFDEKDLDYYLDFLHEIIEQTGIEYGDKRCTYSLNDAGIHFTVGQYYVWNLYRKKRNRFGVISSEPISEKYDRYELTENEPYYNMFDEIPDFTEAQKEKIFEAVRFQLNRTNKSGYRKHNHEIFEKYIFAMENTSTPLSVAPNAISKYPLNQILYGPPGTGKTYKTKQVAVEIIDGKAPEDREQLNKRYNELVSAGQIAFVSFHQSMNYEDFIEGIKPALNEKDEVIYKIEDGIFMKIANDAQQNVITNFDEAYNKLLEYFSDNDNELLELKTPTGKSFYININSKNNINLYTTSNKNKQGVLTKESLSEEFQGESIFPGWQGYVKGIFKILQEKYGLTKKDKGNQNYVLIIDEINRANVSAVFGELISLIEPDKRLGQKESLEAVLPYSKEKFSVPDNLYLIGTMNTADRSVEALDTALRRRFSFFELMPDAGIFEQLGEADKIFPGIKKSDILETINKRIEVLLDRDHTIGHSYLIGVNTPEELAKAFNDKILPLLQEYFYGDYAKIGKVLGKSFVDKIATSNVAFADFEPSYAPDYKENLYRLKHITAENAEEAMQNLLNISRDEK